MSLLIVTLPGCIFPLPPIHSLLPLSLLVTGGIAYKYETTLQMSQHVPPSSSIAKSPPTPAKTTGTVVTESQKWFAVLGNEVGMWEAKAGNLLYWGVELRRVWYGRGR